MNPRVHASVGAVWASAAGLALLLVLVLTAPSVVHLDIGAAEPATVTGAHVGEDHYGRRIRWTDGRGRVEWPGVLGVVPSRLEVELAGFPGRAGDAVAFVAGRRVTRHTLGLDWDVVNVPLTGGDEPWTSDGRLTLDVLSSISRGAPGDERRLGVRLDRVSVVNGSSWQAMAALVWWQALVVVLVGALMWQTGVWLGDAGPASVSVRARLWGVGVLGLTAGALAWWRPWLLQPTGLRALLGAATLGVVLAVMLRRREWVTRPLAAVVAVACASTWLVMVIWSAAYFVDVPRWDIWDAMRLVEKLYAGTLAPSDFWGAHNEHRPMTARLVILANVVTARWNHWYEFVALMATAAIQLLVVVAFVVRSQQHRQRVHPLALVVVAIFLFSATQWENWLRSYHVHIIIGALAPVSALLVLSAAPATWRRLGLAAALAVLGELSFGSGLVAWPLGAVAILVRRDAGWPTWLVAWVTVGTVAVGLYFPGLPERPGYSEVTVTTPFDVVRIGVGMLVNVAMSVVYRPQAFAGPADFTQAWMVAAAGVAVAGSVGLLWVRWRDDTAREFTWLFPGMLIGFGLGATLLASMGRATMGLYALTASRYIVFSACFWVGLVLLLAMASPGKRWGRVPATVALSVLAMAAACAWPGALPYMEADVVQGRRAREALRRGDVGEAASVLYPDGPALERMRAVLQEHRLSLFRPGVR